MNAYALNPKIINIYIYTFNVIDFDSYKVRSFLGSIVLVNWVKALYA